MIEPENPNAARGSQGRIDTDPAPSEPVCFPPSRPPSPASDGEHTVATLVRAFARCVHPSEAQSPAVILEPSGTTAEIRWCGACGAIDLNSRGFGDWIRPGVAQVLGDGDHLAAFAGQLRVRVDRLAAIAKSAHAFLSRLANAGKPERHEASTMMREFVEATEELCRFIHDALDERSA